MLILRYKEIINTMNRVNKRNILKIIAVFLTICSLDLLTMEKPQKRKEPEEQEAISEVKRTRLEDLSLLEKLPAEMQIMVLINVINSAQNVREAIAELHKIMRLSKNFYFLINSEDINAALIQALGKRFFHHDRLKAARLLNTRASRNWFDTRIPVDIENAIKKLIGENTKKINAGDFSALHAYLNTLYPGSNQTIRDRFFSTTAMRIWLSKRILEKSIDRIAALNTIKTKLFADTDANLDEWIAFTIKHIQAGVSGLVKASNFEQLSKLAAEGIDISQNYATSTSLILHVDDLRVLQLLIDSGSLVNTIQANTGDAFIHFIIRSDLDIESMLQGTSLMNADNRKALLKIRTLLQAGANPNIKNDKGQTPLDLIKELQNQLRKNGIKDDPFLKSLTLLLKRHGAQE